MWIASKLGFFSIVSHREQRGFVLVRARVRGDLVNLLTACYGKATADLLYIPQIVEMSDADYRFRIAVRNLNLEEMLLTLQKSVDYDNFKNAVADQADQREKLPAYTGLWSGLRRLQC